MDPETTSEDEITILRHLNQLEIIDADALARSLGTTIGEVLAVNLPVIAAESPDPLTAAQFGGDTAELEIERASALSRLNQENGNPSDIGGSLQVTANLLDNTVDIEGQTVVAKPGEGTFVTSVGNNVMTTVGNTVTTVPEGITPVDGTVEIGNTVKTEVNNPIEITGPVIIKTNGAALPVKVEGGGLTALDIANLVNQGNADGAAVNSGFGGG